MNVQSVTELAIGVDGSSASGVLLIDDITLHSVVGEVITPTDPGTDGLIDEVYVYNRALSESEALWLVGGTAPIDKPF